MPIHTAGVGVAVTPTIIETCLSHYINRRPLREKPTAHIGYHEGLNLVRAFLLYASGKTVEDVQAFTAQWVPTPTWIKAEDIEIPASYLVAAARYLQAQLGPRGIELIGGNNWWQWRRDGKTMRAEWIEMYKGYQERQASGETLQRVMLYVHGGAYYFGSVDEHRYQLQRHARKLKARVLAPRYRLAPQFPFPCGLQDCLAAYLYLIEKQHPSTIIVAGDSAGGGMALSLLVTLRDQGIPLPAGAILLSPWVDLTHSFPSLNGDGKFDYIPAHGFQHRPSMAWPPPNADDMELIAEAVIKLQAGVKDNAEQDIKDLQRRRTSDAASVGIARENGSPKPDPNDTTISQARADAEGNLKSRVKQNLSITVDGKIIEIKDQIQMYASNELLTHPLVSPILQSTLGGLPPTLIVTGGGELLRDEQIYLAHKMANPKRYAPSASQLEKYGGWDKIARYKPTYVQLQVWEDLCHVPCTLSWTRPAKYIYRSVAQFGAWALARAQRTAIDILDDDDISIISTSSHGSAELGEHRKQQKKAKYREHEVDGKPRLNDIIPPTAVGKAGDPLPPFSEHMIRQRVDRHGNVFALEPISELSAMQMKPEDIGIIKPGPVRKWLAASEKTSKKFGKEKQKVQQQRIRELVEGYNLNFEDGETALGGGYVVEEHPPPTALAGRRLKGELYKQAKRGRNWGISMWTGWGTKHDKATIHREVKAEHAAEESRKVQLDGHAGETRAAITANGAVHGRDGELRDDIAKLRPGLSPRGTREGMRSRSRHRAVSDVGQTGPSDMPTQQTPPSLPPHDGTNREIGFLPSGNANRPTGGGIAFPFKLATPMDGREMNASTVTLTGASGTVSPEDVRSVDEPISGRRGNDESESTIIGSDGAGNPESHESPKIVRPPLETFVTANEDGLLPGGETGPV